MTMVTHAIPRRERKKAAVRERIIQTAVAMFGRHGMEDVTVEQIADAADLGKGTIYNYFQTKEDIVVAFMADMEKQVQQRLQRQAVTAGTLESALAEYLRFQFRLKKPYHAFVRVFLAQMFMRTEQFTPYITEMQKAIDPNLEHLFRQLQDRGLLRKDVDPSALAPVFKTMHLGLTALWAVEGPPFRSAEEMLRQEIRFFCEGLKEKSR